MTEFVAAMPEHPEGQSRTAATSRSASFTSIKQKTIDYAKNAMKVEEPDRTLWKLITTFPETPMAIKYLLLVINMFFPGFGTIAFAMGGYRPISKTQLLIGVMQYATSWLVVGYFWSVIWGIMFFHERKTREEERPIIQPEEQQQPVYKEPLPPQDAYVLSSQPVVIQE